MSAILTIIVHLLLCTLPPFAVDNTYLVLVIQLLLIKTDKFLVYLKQKG